MGVETTTLKISAINFQNKKITIHIIPISNIDAGLCGYQFEDIYISTECDLNNPMLVHQCQCRLAPKGGLFFIA
jgi:hypothetical protein